MAIRKIISRSLTDGTVVAADLADDAVTAGKIADSVTLGVGFSKERMVQGVTVLLVRVIFFV